MADYEVELKVRADHDAVRDRLADRGATARGAVRQVDTYFDHPTREFAETDEAVRVRREIADDGTVSRLTYKGPLVESGSKSREELETSVGDADTARAILEALGFAPAATVEKDRERYDLDGYTVVLDEVAGLGEFVEIETRATDLERAREGAVAVLRSLGLDPGDQIRTSYLGLLLASEGPARPDPPDREGDSSQ